MKGSVRPLKAIPAPMDEEQPGGINIKGDQDGLSDPDIPEKRIFVSLLLVTGFVLTGMAFLLWWVPYVGLSNIHPSLPLILALVLGSLLLFALGGAMTLVPYSYPREESFFQQTDSWGGHPDPFSSAGRGRQVPWHRQERG